jgi:hypothetical protein
MQINFNDFFAYTCVKSIENFHPQPILPLHSLLHPFLIIGADDTQKSLIVMSEDLHEQ